MRYLRVHIDDESLVTDLHASLPPAGRVKEGANYIHRAHTWSPEFIEARR
jgi:2-hydroxy-6-oxonona-2,4-dienedioate hydrolase